jgi:hypothetical protein
MGRSSFARLAGFGVDAADWSIDSPFALRF